MKKCFKCGIQKPLEEFYKHPQMADGHLGKCKECARKDVEENRYAKIEYYKAFDRNRGNLPHRIKARKEYAKTEGGKEALRRGKIAWDVRNPRKRAAEILFGNYFRYHRELRRPCEICGAEKVHAHHENYDEPLKVKWLCPKHHSERHKEMRSLGIIP